MDYTELRAAAEAAIPGPWHSYVHGYSADGRGEDGPTYAVGVSSPLGLIYRLPDCEKVDDDNARYIALANPATVLALLDENAMYRKWLTRISEHHYNCAACDDLSD